MNRLGLGVGLGLGLAVCYSLLVR